MYLWCNLNPYKTRRTIGQVNGSATSTKVIVWLAKVREHNVHDYRLNFQAQFLFGKQGGLY